MDPEQMDIINHSLQNIALMFGAVSVAAITVGLSIRAVVSFVKNKISFG